MITLPHDWEAALTRFVDWLLLLGRSPRTVQLYTGALRRFAQFGGLPGHLDQVQLTRFLRDRRAAVSATAVNLDVQALRAYGRCLRAHGESSGWMVIKRQRAPPARLPQPVPSAAYYFNRSYYAQAICYDPVGGGFTASHGVTFATHLR